MEKIKATIRTEQDRNRLQSIVSALDLSKPKTVEIRDAKARRDLEQNARMWAMLTDISQQVEWYGQQLGKDEWKDIFTAALKRLKVVPGLDGGFVVVGAHTSRMTVAEMSDMIELMYSFGAERNIRWSDPTDIANFQE